MRQAGNVVKPEEIDAVLLYVIKDMQFSELDKLYLTFIFHAQRGGVIEAV